MSNLIGIADAVQEEDMFGRITNRIDALIKGNANFEELKDHLHTALEVDTETDGWLASETMVARIAAAHELAKRYAPALETIERQENLLAAATEAVVALSEDVARERKRADDLQAGKDLIAGLLGLIEEAPEPDPDPVVDPVVDPVADAPPADSTVDSGPAE